MKSKISIIIAAALLVVAILAIVQCNTNRTKLKNLEENLQGVDSQKIVKTWVDKYDLEHKQVVTLSGEINMMKTVHKKTFDSLAALLKIKPSSITGITAVGIKTEKEIEVPVTVPGPTVYTQAGCDTIPQSFVYGDKWGSVEGVIVGGKAKVSWVNIDEIRGVRFVKKHGFLNLKRTETVDYHNTNPNSTITNIRDLKVTKTDKKFNISIQAGYGFSKGLQPAPYVGIGVGYKLVEF